MHEIFTGTTIVPILTIERLDDAVPLARALVRGGLRCLEVTLRTPVAPAAIAAIAREVPDAVVGAGTVMRPTDVTTACNAGARFIMTPGLTPDLAAAGLGSDLPFLPGVATPSEIMMARDLGLSFLKFFPAAGSGGAAALRDFASIFRGVAFCPTGGIDEANALDYLTLPNVPMIGATWLAPPKTLAAGDWGAIAEAAQRAASLVEIYKAA